MARSEETERARALVEAEDPRRERKTGKASVEEVDEGEEESADGEDGGAST